MKSALSRRRLALDRLRMLAVNDRHVDFSGPETKENNWHIARLDCETKEAANACRYCRLQCSHDQ